jgi:hypothetical protein
MIIVAILLAAAAPPRAHHAQRDHSNYEEAVQEQIDNMPDGDRKADLQEKLDNYESDENYPEHLKGDREDVEDAIEDCDDCDDPDDAGDSD